MDKVLGCFVIGSEESLSQELEQAIRHHPRLTVTHRFSHYPDGQTLAKLVHTHGPSLVFLSVEDPARAEDLAGVVQAVAPGTLMVAFAAERNFHSLQRAMRAGMRDYWIPPFIMERNANPEPLLAMATNDAVQASRLTPNVCAFLSAKSGAGATITALHTSLELARQSKCRTLLLDYDVRSSVLDFILKLQREFGLSGALDYIDRLDESVWQRIVCRVGGVDIAGPEPGRYNRPLTTEALKKFLNYGREHYEIVCIDLPGTYDDYCLSLLEQCAGIFLVTTPEITSLHMANRRLTWLKESGLLQRTRVVINRISPRSVLGNYLKEVLSSPVFATLPNSYDAVQKAIQDGRPLDRRSALGKAFADLAAKCLGLQTSRNQETAGWRSLVRGLFSRGLDGPNEGRAAPLALPAATNPMALVRPLPLLKTGA